ncbi:hypothetical protein CEXT_775421 [Caerostris extrusa]|uniref:Uncharacterized protein n=1 Tax=Caerostris extrusa TaxID=172846 RepID=A0AAV4QYI7_CAEEX|nr:hypothetical protein CEXT_775421 [Caerostris extrusa]
MLYLTVPVDECRLRNDAVLLAMRVIRSTMQIGWSGPDRPVSGPYGATLGRCNALESDIILMNDSKCRLCINDSFKIYQSAHRMYAFVLRMVIRAFFFFESRFAECFPPIPYDLSTPATCQRIEFLEVHILSRKREEPPWNATGVLRRFDNEGHAQNSALLVFASHGAVTAELLARMPVV